MPIHYPPLYRYSLFRQWDKDVFNQLKEIGKTKKYPGIIGSSEDKNIFLTALIRTQKSLHDWRDFLKDTMSQVKKNNSVDTVSLNKQYPAKMIGKDVPDWVTYPGDKIVNDFIDELETRKIRFLGNDMEMAEFIMRYILGQLGHDWEQTIMMIWEMLGDESELSLRKLNREMRKFDYLKLFD